MSDERRPISLPADLLPLAAEWAKSPVAAELLARIKRTMAKKNREMEALFCGVCQNALEQPPYRADRDGALLAGEIEGLRSAEKFIENCSDGVAIAESEYETACRVTNLSPALDRLVAERERVAAHAADLQSELKDCATANERINSGIKALYPARP